MPRDHNKKSERKEQRRIHKIIKDHAWMTIYLINQKPVTIEEISEEFIKVELHFKGTIFPISTEKDQRAIKRRKLVEQDLKLLSDERFIEKRENLYYITKRGEKANILFSKNWQKAIKVINIFLSPKVPPLVSLFIHIILGTLKLIGFALTGSVSLLADGVDSAIDGFSSIIVSLSMRFKKEKIASYMLLILMFSSSVGIFYESIRILILPIPLEEITFAIVVASVSILLCFLLYCYQRIVGYTRKNLTVLVQSEDSKNHILTGLLVLIGVICGFFEIYIVDGIVGIFIGLLIMKSCYAILQDLISLRKGETIDFEKYKLGLWKRFNRFRNDNITVWILWQIKQGINTTKDLQKEFKNQFHSKFLEFLEIKLDTSMIDSEKKDKDEEIIRFYQDIKEFNRQLRVIEQENLIKLHNEKYTLTEKGEDKILKKLKRYSNKHQ